MEISSIISSTVEDKFKVSNNESSLVNLFFININLECIVAPSIEIAATAVGATTRMDFNVSMFSKATGLFKTKFLTKLLTVFIKKLFPVPAGP